MLAWLRRWGTRAFGIFLCAGAWLIAMGLLSLGQGWFADNFAIHDLHDLILHGVVRIFGATGGAVFFFLAGILMLWVVFADDGAGDGTGNDAGNDTGDKENRN
ncbi:hypothetical protein [Jannaschia sp. CCS1]|uniref:hypothetical protein n=1 Tax=Jannaschia sp. (strain CCS1) TaxID=290400 RepID=UPI000053AE89|nr:hypothetical protein [Jannaschia sp. CCS1]ABD56393.1 hypothetical protein Jann_3476 [Jannaschia sp. CCS1]